MNNDEKACGFPPHVTSVSRLPNGELHMTFDKDALHKAFGIDRIPPTKADVKRINELLEGTLVAYPHDEDDIGD